MFNSKSEEILQHIHYCTNLIQRLVNHEHQHPNAHFQELGIGGRQGLLLHVLIKNDGITQKELTERLRIRSSSIGELLVKLEKSGYLERCSNEIDKRTSNVYLTAQGRIVAENYNLIRAEAVENWCSGLTDDDKSQLINLLTKLSLSMETRLSENGEEVEKEKFTL